MSTTETLSTSGTSSSTTTTTTTTATKTAYSSSTTSTLSVGGTATGSGSGGSGGSSSAAVVSEGSPPKRTSFAKMKGMMKSMFSKGESESAAAVASHASSTSAESSSASTSTTSASDGRTRGTVTGMSTSSTDQRVAKLDRHRQVAGSSSGIGPSSSTMKGSGMSGIGSSTSGSSGYSQGSSSALPSRHSIGPTMGSIASSSASSGGIGSEMSGGMSGGSGEKKPMRHSLMASDLSKVAQERREDVLKQKQERRRQMRDAMAQSSGVMADGMSDVGALEERSEQSSLVSGSDTTGIPSLPHGKPTMTSSQSEQRESVGGGPSDPSRAKSDGVSTTSTSVRSGSTAGLASSSDPSVMKSASRAPKKKKEKVSYRVSGEKFLIYDYYKPTKVIGQGAYAVVIEAMDSRNGNLVAIKKNKGVFNALSDAKRILREIKLLLHFDHDNIISLIGVIPPEPWERDEFDEVYLVMPRMQTTLSKVIRGKAVLSPKHKQYFLYQMLRGLYHLHTAGVLHRDLKPENILVNASDCRLKITDFGLARGMDDDPMTEYVVTRWYRAPEVMCSSRQYDELVDMWSIGCIFAEFWYRKPLLRGSNHIEQLKLIFHYRGVPADTSWIKTPDAKRWVESMRTKQPKEWSTVLSGIDDLASDLLSRMMELNPMKRCSVEEAIRHPWLSTVFKEHDLQRRAQPFDSEFERDAKIKTLFGVRHLMYTELQEFQIKRYAKLKEKRSRLKAMSAATAKRKAEAAAAASGSASGSTSTSSQSAGDATATRVVSDAKVVAGPPPTAAAAASAQ